MKCLIKLKIYLQNIQKMSNNIIPYSKEEVKTWDKVLVLEHWTYTQYTHEHNWTFISHYWDKQSIVKYLLREILVNDSNIVYIDRRPRYKRLLWIYK
jgi:hypothetical protein